MSTPVDFENVEFSSGSNRKVFVNEALTIPIGAAVCYDRTRSVVGQRDHYCSRPTLANELELAGVVVSQGKHTPVGPLQLDVISPETITRGVQVLTDELVAVGDFLSPIPGSFSWGKAVRGRPVFRCTEAFDGTTTAGLVRGDFGFQVISEAEQSGRIVRFFDHFAGAQGVGISTTADVAKFLLAGTSAACVYGDSFGPELAAAQQANGVLSATTNTTNQASVTLNGEPFRLDTGKSVFLRARFALSSLAATTDAFIGLGVTDTDFITAASDYIGFRVANGTLTVRSQKGAAGEISIATGTTLIANEFVEVAILVRNRAAAVCRKDIFVWVNGTQVAYTNNDTDRAEIPDVESLTFIAEVKGSAARTLNIDLVEIGNYVA